MQPAWIVIIMDPDLARLDLAPLPVPQSVWVSLQAWSPRLEPSTYAAADSFKDEVGLSKCEKPRMPGAKEFHVMEMGLVVRATQGIITCSGTEDWRVRGEQCQKLTEDCPIKEILVLARPVQLVP